jgi:uncharacterized protein
MTTPPSIDRRANRLAQSTSPYLLQHAHNPVDWHPWGAEALQIARAQGKPIFLSIGYSACHWCHVMERESFENDAIARLMNEYFVNIKVDREERPDLDEIYMKAVQAISGAGGWPMSVWLTPDLAPFYGGTYFPPVPRYGRPSFPQLVQWLGETWRREPEKLKRQGADLVSHIAKEEKVDTRAELAKEALDRSLAMLASNYDSTWGGFGSAPKFPHAMDVRILLRHHRRLGAAQPLEMARHTLTRMARGGIYDHLAGGFHRYSTDEKWLIPHFEKMLYDNALLVPAFLEGWLVTRDPLFARVARECCDWVLDEMVTPEGGFASTLDADSEGEEGIYYVWTPQQLTAALPGRAGAWAQEWWGVTATGNFEHGASALWRDDDEAEVAKRVGTSVTELVREMEQARRTLLALRKQRIAPAKDDKVLAAWNGLMISALARAAQAFDESRWLAAARRAALYVLESMRQPDRKLYATARAGRAHLNAYFDDYAFMIQGLIDLYETDFDERWLREALELEQVTADQFEDGERGGYYSTSHDHERLIARLKNPHDGALPSGNGVMAQNLLRLAELTGRVELARRAERVILSQGELINRYPAAFSQILQAVDMLDGGCTEIVIAGERGDPTVDAMLRVVRERFLPSSVVALASAKADEDLLKLIQGRKAARSETRAFVCRNYTCRQPVSTAADLAAELDRKPA